MLQNPCKTLGFKKNMVYEIPPGGGEVNHIQPVAYSISKNKRLSGAFLILYKEKLDQCLWWATYTNECFLSNITYIIFKNY